MGNKNKFWLWVGIVVGVYMIVRTGNNIIRLSKAGGRVNYAQLELDKLKVKKQEMERKLAESQTEGYTERIAREKLGLGKPGEVVVILDDDIVSSDQASVISELPNWKVWRKLYLGF